MSNEKKYTIKDVLSILRDKYHATIETTKALNDWIDNTPRVERNETRGRYQPRAYDDKDIQRIALANRSKLTIPESEDPRVQKQIFIEVQKQIEKQKAEIEKQLEQRDNDHYLDAIGDKWDFDTNTNQVVVDGDVVLPEIKSYQQLQTDSFAKTELIDDNRDKWTEGGSIKFSDHFTSIKQGLMTEAIFANLAEWTSFQFDEQLLHDDLEAIDNFNYYSSQFSEETDAIIERQRLRDVINDYTRYVHAKKDEN